MQSEVESRLAAAVDRLKAYTDAPAVIYAVPGVADHLAVKHDDLLMAQYRLAEAASLIERLYREREKLREALKPFVAQFDAIEARYKKRGGCDLSFVPDGAIIGTKPHLTYADFRRARSALAEQPQ
jgi:ribosomal protein L25 (general stress protein Ctc)